MAIAVVAFGMAAVAVAAAVAVRGSFHAAPAPAPEPAGWIAKLLPAAPTPEPENSSWSTVSWSAVKSASNYAWSGVTSAGGALSATTKESLNGIMEAVNTATNVDHGGSDPHDAAVNTGSVSETKEDEGACKYIFSSLAV